MRTRALLPLATAAALALAGASAAATVWPEVPVEYVHGGHVQIRGAYLRHEEQAVVRGMVRRDPLWSGATPGHIDAIAYDASGEIAHCATRWTGAFASPGDAVPFTCRLGVPRAAVTHLRVAFHGATMHQGGAR